jgi:hypothetical protein
LAIPQLFGLILSISVLHNQYRAAEFELYEDHPLTPGAEEIVRSQFAGEPDEEDLLHAISDVLFRISR